ncbi:unnamed protein product [Nezara viridula]|uniref:EF-hand domain-containing protein n=1 Tax=Nezara viridula TaxID=85310 RepID=A0A9P0HDX4_NEZVI|nr:unnamed protein product [Nezara viridula]
MWRRNFPKDAASRIQEIFKLNERPPTHDLESRSGFDKKELDGMKDVFRYFDRDQNRHLDQKELKELFKYQVGSQIHEQNFQTVFKKMDLNSDGVISFPEFVSHQSSRNKELPTTKVIHENFALFDRNEDGFLNLDEVRHLLLYMGEEAGRVDLRQLFVAVDSDKDGRITKKEFHKMMRDYFKR